MHEAEDVVQDTFIKIWDQKENFNNESAIKNFLYVSVRNACVNINRHKQVRVIHAETQPADSHIEQTGFLNNIIKAEVISHVHQAAPSLPDGCKRIFKLSYFEELKNPQIAEMLKVTVNTVKTQKYRAIHTKYMSDDSMEIPYSSLKTILPIPLAETNANSNIDQNEGYK